MSEFDIEMSVHETINGCSAVFVTATRDGVCWTHQFNFGPRTEIADRMLTAQAYEIDPGWVCLRVLRQQLDGPLAVSIAEVLVEGKDATTPALPWTIKDSWEQHDPGLWITDAAGGVIYAEGVDPGKPDVPMKPAVRALLANMLFMDGPK